MGFLGLDAETLSLLLSGLWMTVIVCLVSLALGLVIGLLACFGKLMGRGPLALIARGYIDLFRTLPEIVTIFWIYACFPLVFGLRLGSIESGILALTLYAGAFLAEIFRAGIQSIPRGQFEAARSLGVPPVWIWLSVVFPQMIRLMLPAFVAFLTDLVKVSGLLSAIGVAEMVYQARVISARNFEYFEMFTAIGIMYFLLIFPLSMIAQRYERKLALLQR
jgi:His/Glu/Gln/Arg/opine family amino acid ABC transporter permease subunit